VQEDIPTLLEQASQAHPGVSYSITQPLGLQDEIIRLIHLSVLGAATTTDNKD
jgi:sirohydrochlorin ferrochelatase